MSPKASGKTTGAAGKGTGDVPITPVAAAQLAALSATEEVNKQKSASGATTSTVVGNPAGAARPTVEDEGFFSAGTVNMIIKTMAIYACVRWAAGQFLPKVVPEAVMNKIPQAPTAGGVGDSLQSTGGGGNTFAPPTIADPNLELLPLWPKNTLVDVLIKLSTSADPSKVFDGRDSQTGLPSVTWEGVQLGTKGWTKEWDTEWDVPISVQTQNASLWIDLFLYPSGQSPDPKSTTIKTYAKENHLHVRKLITRYMPQRKVRELKKLIGGSTKNEKVPPSKPEIINRKNELLDEKKEVLPIISYYHPNVSFEIVAGDNTAIIPYSALPDPVKTNVHVAEKEGIFTADGKTKRGYHYPITWANDFWLMKEHMNPINETTTRLPLRVTLNPTSYMKFQIFTTMEESFAQQAKSMGGGGSEFDEVKRMLTETNPVLLVTTVVVSLLHMLFEFLAFTSDIGHWRNKKELVGVSVRTILTNCFVQLVILLYLLDNNDNTSWMILFGQGMGLLIEAWKITKAVDIKIISSPTTVFPYKIDIKDKHVLSEDELKTQEYDQLAFKWVAWGTTPLLIGYTIYSMYYNEHKSWYSFVISTLTSFVYAFGFITLIPQLILNMKLKSVAHMPMKTMTYKFFNTIVDDFFSFVIKMPWLHRLACFRDDVVFLILLYQMWIYKVDPTRANEYGQQLTEVEAAKLLASQKETEMLAKGDKLESMKDK